MPCFKKGIQAVSFMQKKFPNIEWNSSTTAKKAHTSNDPVSIHYLDNFRTKFNKLKKILWRFAWYVLRFILLTKFIIVPLNFNYHFIGLRVFELWSIFTLYCPGRTMGVRMTKTIRVHHILIFYRRLHWYFIHCTWFPFRPSQGLREGVFLDLLFCRLESGLDS